MKGISMVLNFICHCILYLLVDMTFLLVDPQTLNKPVEPA